MVKVKLLVLLSYSHLLWYCIYECSFLKAFNKISSSILKIWKINQWFKANKNTCTGSHKIVRHTIFGEPKFMSNFGKINRPWKTLGWETTRDCRQDQSNAAIWTKLQSHFRASSELKWMFNLLITQCYLCWVSKLLLFLQLLDITEENLCHKV